MNKVRYGIIGIGKMGSIHSKRIQMGMAKGAVLTAVCDNNEKRIEWAKKNLKKIKIYADYKEMLTSGEIDAVIISTPHYGHPSIAIDAIEAGIHTIIEKPAGVYTSAVRKLYEVAEKHKEVKFGIMYNQRTFKLHKKAKEWISEGRLGEFKRVNYIITNWYRPQAYYNQGGWRGTWAGEGGGVLLNQCPHQIDLLQYLCGMPNMVKSYAKVGIRRDINVENDVTAYFEFDNNGSGVFIASTHDSPGTNRLEITGDKGKIVIEDRKLVFYELKEAESEFNKTNKKFMPKIPYKKHIIRQSLLGKGLEIAFGDHMNIIRNFTNSILFGEELIAPGQDGIKGLSLSNAMHLSSWTKSEINFPFDEKLFEEELAKRIEEEKEYNKKANQ